MNDDNSIRSIRSRRFFWLLSVVLAAVQLLNVERAHAQKFDCRTAPCIATPGTKMSCYPKAGTCLTLICKELVYTSWWRKEILVGNAVSNTDEMEIFIGDGNLLNFIIKRVAASDAGVNSYVSRSQNEQETRMCNFSILAYESDKRVATVNISNSTQNLNENAPTEIETRLRDFSESTSFTYRFEALPLDFLLVNNINVTNAVPCESTAAGLGCLEADVRLDLIRCANSETISLSYGINNANLYPQDLVTTRRLYNVKFNFMYPPQVRFAHQSIGFSQLKQDIELVCDVECANPGDNLQFTWFKRVDNVDELIAFSEKNYRFSLSANTLSDTFHYGCNVRNSIDASNFNSSTATFTIEYKAAQSSNSKSGGLETWAIILIVVGAVALVVLIVVAVLILRCCRGKSDKEEKKDEKVDTRPDVEIEMNRPGLYIPPPTHLPNVRQLEESNELTDNPLYGKVSQYRQSLDYNQDLDSQIAARQRQFHDQQAQLRYEQDQFEDSQMSPNQRQWAQRSDISKVGTYYI